MPSGDCTIISTSILEAIGIIREKQDRVSSNRVAHIMRRLGFVKKMARSGNGWVKAWVKGEGSTLIDLKFYGPSQA